MAVQIGKVGGDQPLLKAVEPVEGREDHNERRDPGQHAAESCMADRAEICMPDRIGDALSVPGLRGHGGA